MCRFSRGESEGQRPRLFTIVNPLSAKLPSFLQRWDTSSFLLVQSVSHAAALSALTVSPCGKFVAVGSMSDGFVDIYTAFNLQVSSHQSIKSSFDSFAFFFQKLIFFFKNSKFFFQKFKFKFFFQNF